MLRTEKENQRWGKYKKLKERKKSLFREREREKERKTERG